MTTNVKVISGRDFVRARPDGHANVETAEKLIADIAQAGAGLDEFAILVDTRDVSDQLTAFELWKLSAKLVRFRHTFERRTAVLCPAEKFDLTQFFPLCAANHGLNISAFTSYEGAMEWLIGEG